MGISEKLGEIYSKAEEKFYSAMDFLADKGVPVYSIIDPLEERGIPFMPTAFAAAIIGLFLVYGLLFLSASSSEMELSLNDYKGASLSGVSLSAFYEGTDNEIDLGSSSFRDGQIVNIGVGKGSNIVIIASKEGYEDSRRTVFFDSDQKTVDIKLKKIQKPVEGIIKLADSETGDYVDGAKITVTLSEGASIECLDNGSGEYSCAGVLEGENAEVLITQPNYEQKSIGTIFFSESDNEIELVPKASASLGKTNVIVRVFDFDTQERIGNFNLKIFDTRDQGLITEKKETDNDGEQVERISKGTPIRIVVEREEYLIYDSSVEGNEITLREDEKIVEVYLRKGTNALTAVVLDATARPMSEVTVLLYNENNELISSKETTLTGEAVFDDLSSDGTYYVSAWRENFLPATERVSLSEKNKASLRMERGTASNSGSLTVYTVDDKSISMNGVFLDFFIDNDGDLSPLGVPQQKTDITGKLDLLVPLNKTIVVKGSKNELYGQESITVLDTFNNEILIMMKEPSNEVKVIVVDEKGDELAGTITIVAGDNVLYDGDYEQGGVTVNPSKNKYLTVLFYDEQDNGFQEEIYVEGLEEVTVSQGGVLGGGVTPVVEFLGIYTINGEESRGIAKGIDYFLKYRVIYPEGNNKYGFHVRVGEDTVGFADSQDAGIIGFSAPGAASFYSRSYSPIPKPGFEALDFQNSGNEGSYNKWLELYFSSGGEKIIKVRVKAKETADSAETEVQYRAWSEIGDKIYRMPEDSELELEEFSSEKTGLYAETFTDKIRILEDSASCSDELCASYKFFRSDGSEFSVDNFKAAKGEVYALEVNLSPSVEKDVTIKASTSKTKPKIGFQGFRIDSEADFPDSNSQDTTLSIDNVLAKPGETTSVRLFFKAFETENSYITLQVISDETTINEEFRFEVYNEKRFVMRTVPDNVIYGEDFSIVLEDEDSNPVEDAEIKLFDSKGEHIETISGNNSSTIGANGKYLVKNSFDEKSIGYEIRAPDFRSLAGTIGISKDGMLAWEREESFISIPKSSQSGETAILLKNASLQNMEGVTFSVEPIGGMPEGMEINVLPVNTMPAGYEQRIVVTAQYSGSNEREHVEANLIAKATTETGAKAIARTKITVDYNPKIASDCVEFSKSSLSVFVASGFEDRSYYDTQYYMNQNNIGGNSQLEASYNQLPPNLSSSYYKYNSFSTSTNETFTAKLADKTNCQIEMNLKAEVLGKGDTQGLEINAQDIKLSPQLEETEGRRSDTEDVIVNITNRLIRNYPGKEKFSFNLIYKDEGFEKSIPVDVYVWNPRYALQVSRNIELFLGPNDRGQLSAQVPLFVRNVGEADIENIDFRVSSATSRGNVDVTVVPSFPIQFLKKGQSIDPPKTLLAQALRNEKTTIGEVKQLDITGVIDGTTFSFGPVILTAHISAAQCLTAVPGNLAFISTKTGEGALSQDITLRNTCAEEVRVVDISQPRIGSNKLLLNPTNAFIAPGSEATFTVVLEKNEPYSGPAVPVYVQAFLPNSGTSMESSPIIVDIKLGKYVEKGEAATETVPVPICEGDGKQTKEVRFPVIASGSAPLCDTAYCDATQLSNYLSDRLEESIRDAEKQVQNRSAEIQKSDCTQTNLAKGYCTFEGLGVKTQRFTVYMSQDNMSTAMLQKSISAKNSTIRNFRVDYFEGDAGGEFLGGYSRQIFLNSNMRGCGRYNVELKGSVAVQGSRIVPELMNVVIDITPEDDTSSPRQITEQCLPNIQNVMNFLPKDEGLTKSQKYDTWMGVVEPKDEKLSGLSEDVAKSIFGSKERAVNANIGTNTLNLELGGNDSYIVKVEMDRNPTDNPVQVNAFIRNTLEADGTVRKEVVDEAAQAIRNLRENQIQGCIGEDMSYVLLKSAKDIGQLQIEPPKSVNVQFETEICSEFTVSSNLAEKVNVTARKKSLFEGLNGEPYIKTAQTKEEAGIKAEEISIDKLNEATNRFEGKALLCTLGNSQFHLAQGKTLVLEAKRNDGQGKAQSQEVPISVCGIHPLDFMDKISSKEATKEGEYYYATFVWKGNPDEIKISDLSKISEVEKTEELAKQITAGERGIKDTDSDEVKAAKRKATLYYGATCGATSLVTSLSRPLVGWGAAFFNLIADCGVPMAALYGSDAPVFNNMVKFVETTVLQPVKELFDGFTGAIGTGIKWAFGALGIGNAGSAIEVAQGLSDSSLTEDQSIIVNAYVDQAVLTDIIRGRMLSTSGKISNEFFGSKAKLIADDVAEEVTEKIRDGMFDGKSTAAVNEAIEAYKEKISAEIKGKLTSDISAKRTFTKSGFGHTASLTEAEAKDSVIKALSEAEKKALRDPAFLTKLNAARTEVPEKLAFSEKSLRKEVADELVGKIESGSIAEKAEIRMGATAPTSTAIDTAISTKNTQLIDRFISETESRLGVTISGTPLETDLRSVPQITSLDTPVQSAGYGKPYVGEISKEQTTELYRRLDRVISNEIANGGTKSTTLTTKATKLLEKKFSEKGISNMTKVAGESTDIAKATPKFWSAKGILSTAKNFLKEGAFGLLANFVGLKAYDIVLESQLGKADTSDLQRREEFAGLQAKFLGNKFEPSATSEDKILKYRTYRVKVILAPETDTKRYVLERTENIPEKIEVEKWVLNNCGKDQGFDKGMGSAFPGMIPEVENQSNFPEYFTKTPGLAKQHVEIAKNYLKEQTDKSRYGAQIASATEEFKNTFAANSGGENLEALVVSIGVTKSALGTDPQYGARFMFGCDKDNNAKESVYANAYCAAQKLTLYSSECTNDISCYLKRYNADPANESGGRFRVTDSDFEGIYSKWKSYAWNAS